MIYGIVGGLRNSGMRGNGKTATMTYFLIRHHLRGWKVYANYKLGFESEYMGVSEIKDAVLKKNLQNVVIGFDEIQLFLNSLGEKKKIINEFVHQLIAQTRKRSVDVYYTTQRYADVHARLRAQTDVVLCPLKFHEEDDSECFVDRCKRKHYIEIFRYIDEKTGLRESIGKQFYAEKVGLYYDQNEIIESGTG